MRKTQNAALGRQTFARLKNKGSWMALTVLATSLMAVTASAPASAAGKYEVIATLQVGGVLQISADPTRGLVFVGNGTGVTVIDEKTFATTVITLPEGIRCVVVDPIHWTVYADSATSVYTIDERTFTVLGSTPIALPTGSLPLKMGIDPFRGLLYVSDDFLAEVTEIDEARNSILTTIPTPATHGYVDDIGVDPINKLFFIAGHYSAGSAFAIYVGDERTGKIINTYLLPGSTPGQVIPDPVTKQLYVPGYYDGSLTILDEFTGAVKHITYLPAGATPGTLTLDPFTETLFTSDNSNGGNVYAVNALTGAIKAIIPTGNGGDGITVDPVTGLVFSVNYLQGTISVIKEGPGTPCDVLRNNPGLLNGDKKLIQLYCAPKP